MKKIIVCLLLIFSVFSISRAQSWQWAKSAGDTLDDNGGVIATDRAGNTYMIGSYLDSSITFGSYTLKDSGGFSGVFLVKYSPAGNVIWARSSWGKNSNGEIAGIAVDDSCNIYITGGLSSSQINFGKLKLVNGGYSQMYLIKYDSSGNAKWARTDSINTDCQAGPVTVDHRGHVYVAGYYSAGQPVAFGKFILPGPAGSNLFVVRYDLKGNVNWAECSSGNTDQSAANITVDSSGNSYVTGGFSSITMIFGKDTLVNPNNAVDVVYLVKYDSTGNEKWAICSKGTKDDYSGGLRVDNMRNIYLAGGFESPVFTFGTTSLNLTIGENIYLIKFDSSGKVIWAKSVPGNNYDAANSLCFDQAGNILMAGIFWSSTLTFGSSVLNNVGHADVFAAAYDTAGNAKWGIAAGGSIGDYGYSISTDGQGSFYVGGDFYSSNLAFGTTYLASNGGLDVFLAKLSVPLGIPGLTKEYLVSVYPDPSNGKFTFQLPVVSSQWSVEVYNVLGEKVTVATLKPMNQVQGDNLIDLSDKPNGIYFYRVIANSGNILGEGKLVIQK